MLKKLLVANCSEIAIRIMRAANEIGMRTVAIFSEEDRFALHRFKADAAYQVGETGKPLAAYLDIARVVQELGRARFLHREEAVREPRAGNRSRLPNHIIVGKKNSVPCGFLDDMRRLARFYIR